MKLRVIISLDTHANNKVIYSTRRKHFVLCVGTALRCKGEIAMSSISKNTRRFTTTWMRGMKTQGRDDSALKINALYRGLFQLFCFR